MVPHTEPLYVWLKQLVSLTGEGMGGGLQEF
jgi:hypothetical protein